MKIIVVDKKYLPKKILNLFKKEPVKLAPWDPMGALSHLRFDSIFFYLEIY